MPSEGSWWNCLLPPHEVVSRRQQQQERTGATGLANHIKKKHPTQYKEAMELIGTKEERNAPVAAAIGEESRDDKKLQN